MSFSIKGDFSNDIPVGSWQLQFNEFQSNSNSTVKDNQYIVDVSGMQHIASGVLKDGNPDGTWTLLKQRIKNSKTDKTTFKSVIDFKEGVPQRNFTIENEQQKLVGRFLRNGQELKKLKKSDMLTLLVQNDRYYSTINNVFSNLRPASFMAKFNVKVSYYPFESKESKQFKSIASAYTKSREISNSLINNTQLTILKLADKNVRSLADEVDTITEKVLDPLKPVMNYQKEEILIYTDRNALFSKIWPNGIPDTQNTSDNVVAIESLTKKTYDRLEAIKKELSEKIIYQERKEESIELEKKMIAQRDYLKQLSDSLQIDTIPALYKGTIQNIIKNTEDKLATYSSIKDVNKKLEYARELVYCFEQLDHVGETIVKLPKQEYKIQEAYLDPVWNPFTATLMNETIKKRLVTSYTKNLIPHFLKRIEEGLACEETEQWIVLVNSTYDRMLALRDQDTHKLERKLKKEQNSQIILDLLAIKSESKNE